LSGEIVACRRRKENSSSNEVGWITAPAHRHTVVERGGEGRIIEPCSR